MREWIEHDAVITLAGIVATEIWRTADGYRPESPIDEEIERIARELEDAGYVERLQRFEATPPLDRESDADHIFRLGSIWFRDEKATGAFVRWIVAETAALVRSPRFAKPLAAVTEALLTHGALPGNEVHRLAADTDPAAHAEANVKAKVRAIRSFDDFPNVQVTRARSSTLTPRLCSVSRRASSRHEPLRSLAGVWRRTHARSRRAGGSVATPSAPPGDT